MAPRWATSDPRTTQKAPKNTVEIAARRSVRHVRLSARDVAGGGRDLAALLSGRLAQNRSRVFEWVSGWRDDVARPHLPAAIRDALRARLRAPVIRRARCPDRAGPPL